MTLIIDGFNGNNITNVYARVCGPNLTYGRRPNRINNNSYVPLEEIIFITS